MRGTATRTSFSRLSPEHQRQFDALIRRGQAPATRLLRCSTNTIKKLEFGGSAEEATIARITEALDRIAKESA